MTNITPFSSDQYFYGMSIPEMMLMFFGVSIVWGVVILYYGWKKRRNKK